MLNNCLSCGTGRCWWALDGDGYRCPVCHGDPELEESGDSDHKLRQRQRMVKQYGPRLSHDELLLDENPRRGRERYVEAVG